MNDKQADALHDWKAREAGRSEGADRSGMTHDAKIDGLAHQARRVEPMAAQTPIARGVTDERTESLAAEVMAKISPEGRPASRETRHKAKWLLLGVICTLGTAAAVTLAIDPNFGGLPTVLLMLILLLVLAGATWPVWTAGFLRGGEEKKAETAVLRSAQRSGRSKT